MNGATLLPNAAMGLELGSLPSSLRLLVLGDPGYVNLSASPMLFYVQIMFALCHIRLSSGLDFLMRCVPFAMWIACDLFSHKDGCRGCGQTYAWLCGTAALYNGLWKIYLLLQWTSHLATHKDHGVVLLISTFRFIFLLYGNRKSQTLAHSNWA